MSSPTEKRPGQASPSTDPNSKSNDPRNPRPYTQHDPKGPSSPRDPSQSQKPHRPGAARSVSDQEPDDEESIRGK